MSDWPRKASMKHKYSQSELVEAIRRIGLGELSLRQASDEYKIPRSTLFDKMTERRPMEGTVGPDPFLSRKEEDSLADTIIRMKTKGQKCTKKDIAEMAKKIIEADGRKNPFRDNKPGHTWLKRFIERNPKLAVWHPKPEDEINTKEIIDQWYVKFNKYLREKDCLSITEFPDRMWNVEEQLFGVGSLRGIRGFKLNSSSSRRYEYTRKNRVSSILAMSASGLYSPPLMSYPGKKLPEGLSQSNSGPPLCFIGNSQYGGIDEDLFITWLKEHFLPFLVNRDIDFPVLMLVDGHSKYVTRRVEHVCDAKGIHLFKLPTESSLTVSPYELGARGTLKDAYTKGERAWRKEHASQSVSMCTFHRLFLHAWLALSEKPVLAKIGFWCAGLFPFDGKYNKDQDEYPHPEAEEETGNADLPSSSNGSPSSPAPSPTSDRVTVEVTLAPEDSDIVDVETVEVISSTKSCKGTVNEKRCTSDGKAGTRGRNKSNSAQQTKATGSSQTAGRRSLKRKDKMTGTASSPAMEKSPSTAKKRKPNAKEKSSAVEQNERPEMDMQQARRAIRSAKTTLKEAERVACDAMVEVKVIKKELLVAEMVERDAKKDVRKAKKALKVAENHLTQLQMNEISNQETPLTSAPIDVNVNEQACPVCGGKFEESDVSQKLVSCSNCPRRYHVMCTDLYCVPQEKILHIKYRCPICAYL